MLDPWYVTGLIEGEGSFTFHRSGKRVFTMVFAIKLTSLDQNIIEELADFFGVGRIYAVKPSGPGKNSGYTKSASYYRVTKSDDLQEIIAHFESFPMRGTKQQSFLLWKEIVELKARNFRKQPLDEIEALLRELSASSPRNASWDGPAQQAP